MQWVHVTEGLRIFFRRLRVLFFGLRKYPGDSKQICEQIIQDSYNYEKNYFMVSTGHFKVFYCRDFGWITKSLIELGHRDKVKNTLAYALEQFKKYGRVRTTINPQGIPFDFPYYAVDSLPYILNSLAILNDKKLVDGYREFLNSEIDYFFKEVVDTKTGIVKKDKFFSSMKDHSQRKSSCYDNCMLYMMQKSCDALRLNNPLKNYNYKKIILSKFWTGRYFLDDLSGKRYVAGDAQVFPFWTGVVDDKKMLMKVIGTIQENNLDYPLPLKYTSFSEGLNFHCASFLASNYEGDVLWAHMAMLYVALVGNVDPKLQRFYIDKYKCSIEKYGTYLELYNPDGTPYSTLLYHADEGMSWCANYLNLLRINKIKS